MTKMVSAKRLKNKKAAVAILLLLGFGAGLASIWYGEHADVILGKDFASSSIGLGASRPAGVGFVPVPQYPAPAPAPQPQQPPPTPPRLSQMDKEAAGKAIVIFQQTISPDRMVVSTASIGLNVSSVTRTVAEVRRIADGLGGFVTDSFVEPIPRGKIVERGLLVEPSSRASLTMRIPSDQLDKAISQILSLGELISFSTTSRDVTEQYIDLNARQKNLQSVLEQYKEIMKMAKTVSDIIAIQQRIDSVQEQIEVITAQIKRIQAQVSLATITVSLIEPQIVEKPKKVEEPTLLDRLLLQPLSIALALAEITLRGLLILGVGLLPLYSLAGAGYIAYRRYFKKG